MTTTPSRVTRFAIQGDGARSFGINVNGLKVLVTAASGDHEAGAALAHAIAALGPEDRIETVPPTPEPATYRAKRRDFRTGQRVWCNVHGCEGLRTVTEVGSGRNRGRIKIAGERAWCPAHNFDEVSP